MKTWYSCLRWLALLLPLSLMAAEATQASYPFTSTIAKPGLTTAAIFDARGRVVRVLWTMKRKEAGALTGTWNGRDNDGNAVPPGDYTWKVVLNRSIYTSLGVIGNTGLPPNTSGHVPIMVEGVAVDAKGAAYTVHAWDEPGHDVVKWSPQTGQAEFHTGHVIGEALLQGIAVEPDGSRAYVSGGCYTDPKARKLSLWRVNLAGSPEPQVENFTKAGRSIVIYDGNAADAFPPGTSKGDRDLVMPLSSLAVQGDTLYATDVPKGRVLLYDKVSGELKREIPALLACGLAVTPDGRIWVGHERTKVSVFDATGRRLGTPITDLQDVRALALRGSTLYVADRGASQVRQYTVAGTTAKLVRTFGEPQRPGDRAAQRLSNIRGLAVDAQGNLLLSDRMGDGSRLQKLTPEFKQVWRQMGLEFSSQGAFGVDNPDLLLTFDKNAYTLDRSTGAWEFLGCARTDLDGAYFGNRSLQHSGPPRILRQGGQDFLYYPRGDGLAIYRIDPPADATRGPTLHLAACVAGRMPTPDGTECQDPNAAEQRFLWSWHDEQGDHLPQSAEITIAAGPDPANPKDAKWNWVRGAQCVDDRGWLWIVSYDAGKPAVIGGGDWGQDGKTIYALAPRGLDKLGNPIYDWKDAVRVVAPQVGREALRLDEKVDFDFGWKLVNASSADGMIYALANVNKPGMAGEPGLHMGGNLLVGLQGKPGGMPEVIAQVAWTVALPNMAVGLSPIPGGAGGVLIGGDPWRGGVRHYTRDGLLIGGFQSDARFGEQPVDWPSGLLDAYLAVNCNRDPRDGLLDVFTEDNVNQRLIWHRVDDRDITTTEGKLVVK